MCGCSSASQAEAPNRVNSKEISNLLNKWIMDIDGRKLLVQSPIYDVYNDIIGFLTKNEDGNVIRIFKRNVAEVLG